MAESEANSIVLSVAASSASLLEVRTVLFKYPVRIG